jgi:hypothetical protein
MYNHPLPAAFPKTTSKKLTAPDDLLFMRSDQYFKPRIFIFNPKNSNLHGTSP